MINKKNWFIARYLPRACKYSSALSIPTMNRVGAASTRQPFHLFGTQIKFGSLNISITRNI
jgi:hypothetical protein